ncbi:DUF397 domain-containing protein [Streptomyces sp. NPDC015144]|uniref:DUF397 domain-containing protein n=1 Tax=Streptomyces sp. NPDC015144 TaxID=3364944 RepID=UPI0036FB1EAB
MYSRPDLTSATWRASSYSNSDGGQCVEVCDDYPSVVPVRDSKNPGPAVIVSASAWSRFVSAL